MKKQNGITLIALVISIIVMLILAGVSINAIVGENGVLSRAQYSSFMSEMAAVEEAVQLWKAGELMETKGEVDTAIPANGLCSRIDVDKTERLGGEIGYYREWSISGKPSTNILSSDVDFNVHKRELVEYPAGIQDLYYLNNEALDLDEDKVYLIDAATSIVYSTTGITLNGVKCYSTHMAKAVMGNNIEPLFAEAEMSGGGDDIVYAGATYLKDKNGNYIDENGNIVSEENKVLNPYGFKIIAHPTSNNIYKLYNNGELYGKGIKGVQLNTSSEELSKVDDSKWHEFTIPSEIKNYKKVIQGANTMYIIDNEDNLFAWGDNTSNKLGLTQEEQIEYTGREPIKINVAGKKVEKVFDVGRALFVVTKDNCLYGMGSNIKYELGIGHNNEIYQFEKINFENPNNIKNILRATENNFVLIQTFDNNFFATGNTARSLVGDGVGGSYKKLVPVWNGYDYLENEQKDYVINEVNGYRENLDIDNQIKKVIIIDSTAAMLLFNNGEIYHIGNCSWNSIEVVANQISAYPSEFGTDVKDIVGVSYGYVILRNNGEVWGADGVENCIGAGGTTKKAVKLQLPDDLINSGIKEIFSGDNCIYYLSNDGKLYGSAREGRHLGLTYAPVNIEEIISPGIKTFYPEISNYFPRESYCQTSLCRDTIIFQGNDDKLYSIASKNIVFRNSVLEQQWSQVASNVKHVALGENEAIAYIERNTNNLYVAGNDSRILGLNTETQEKISGFVQVNDVAINGKVKDVQFSYGQMYVLTTDNELYSTGICSIDGTTGWPNDRIPGWEELENHYTLVKILDDVSMFSVYDYEKMAIANNKLYTWGGNTLGNLGQTSRSPKEYDISDILDVTNIRKILPTRAASHIILNDGTLYARGYYVTPETIAISRTDLRNYKNISEEYNGEKIIDTAIMNWTVTYQLTDNGNVYGWGKKSMLGINSTSASALKTAQKLPLENVVQIVAGNEFAIAVTKDGKVYGTGSNVNGILGRWIGVDRNSPNSRYKTAFEWVECPELEI